MLLLPQVTDITARSACSCAAANNVELDKILDDIKCNLKKEQRIVLELNWHVLYKVLAPIQVSPAFQAWPAASPLPHWSLSFHQVGRKTEGKEAIYLFASVAVQVRALQQLLWDVIVTQAAERRKLELPGVGRQGYCCLEQ